MRKYLLQSVWLTAIVLAISGCGGGDGATANAGAKQSEAASQAAVDPSKIESFGYVGKGDPSPFKARALNTKRAAALIDLGALPQSKRAQQTDDMTAGVPRKIGLRREISQTANTGDTSGRLAWQAMPTGARVATVGFRSPDAVGMRLGVLINSLPGDAIVRAYAPSGATAFETSGREVLATIDANRAAGMVGDDAHMYWMPTVDGSEAVLEIEVPTGLSVASVQIAIPQLSHLYRSAQEAASNPTKVGHSASCGLDVSCRSDYADESKSVAAMLFVKSGATYVCSGTLLADRAKTETPWFLSAHHCISNQATASTLETFWFYRSDACNSGIENANKVRLAGGAALVYSAAATDTAFLRLNSAPPAGVAFAGSSNSYIATGTQLTGLHHPQFDIQKISEGAMVANANCQNVTDSSSFSCQYGDANSSYIALKWSAGIAEGGSSGSSVFATSGGKRYVVGQLKGGNATCAIPDGFNFYGRFDIAYNAKIKTYLDPEVNNLPLPRRTAVYRFYNGKTQAHFFTASVAERDYVIANLVDFSYEGAAFYAYLETGVDLTPVFRFYNRSTGAHFYTINASERDYVVINNPQFTFEGPTWYARTQPASGSQPIYRFYNLQSGNHFYTISQAERNYILNNNLTFKYEGEGYQGWTSQ